MVHKIWHARFERMQGWMDGQMHNPKPISPIIFFEVGGIIMHLSMFLPRKCVCWGGGEAQDYPRELDNFEKWGLIPYPCDTILCLKSPGRAFKFSHNFF